MTVVRILKGLLAIGITRKLNQALERLALNHWHWRRPGAPWDFGPWKQTELVVITGGCGGFGFEMVRAFAKVARVVLLDVSPVPSELEICECSLSQLNEHDELKSILC